MPPSKRAGGAGKCRVPAFVPGLLCQDVQPSPDLPAGAFTLCHQLPHRLHDLPKGCFPHTCSHPRGSAPAASSCALPQRDAGEPLSRNGATFLLSRQTLFAKKLPRGWTALGWEWGQDRKGKCKKRLKTRRGKRRPDQDFFLLISFYRG